MTDRSSLENARILVSRLGDILSTSSTQTPSPSQTNEGASTSSSQQLGSQARAYQTHQQLFGYQKRASSKGGKGGLETKRKSHTFVCLANNLRITLYLLLGKAKIELFESTWSNHVNLSKTERGWWLRIIENT